jgi:hypothetical protein
MPDHQEENDVTLPIPSLKAVFDRWEAMHTPLKKH